METTKKVKLELVGLDGNAYSLIGAFAKQARREDWTKEEIGKVVNRAMSGDYNNLLRVLMDHTESPANSEEGDEEEEDWD